MSSKQQGCVWIIVYIVAVMLANYYATTFIPLPVFGLLSVGTLIFGITFTARDFVHGMGRKYVYGMILSAAVASTAMAVFLAVPMRIIAASFITIMIAETVDTEIYQRFISRSWIVRVSASNSVSIPVDSILFNLIAFAWVMPWTVIVQIIFGDIVWKWISGFLFAMLRYVGFKEAKIQPELIDA